LDYILTEEKCRDMCMGIIAEGSRFLVNGRQNRNKRERIPLNYSYRFTVTKGDK
jgi:hypothetical protein